MADNTFEILIKYGLDKTKATEAVAELKKLEEAGKRTGTETAKSTEQATAKFGDMKKSVALVSGELGGVGQLLRWVFNPGILGAAALAKSVGEVWGAFQKFMQGLKDSAVNAARSVGNIKQAMLDLDIERAKADVNFKTSMDDFERRSNRKIEVINLEKEAVLQLLDAREKADLAAAKSPEEKEAVKQRYDSARQNATEQATAKEVSARDSGIKEMASMAKSRFREGYAASGDRTPEQVKLALKKMPDELKSLDEQIAAQEKIVGDLSSITTTAGAFPYYNDPENYRTQLEAYASSNETLGAMRNTRNRIADRQLPLTSADAAYGAADSLMGRVRTDREDLSNFQTDSESKRQTNYRASAIASGHGGAGELVSSAAAGADAIRGGGKATADQSAAINQLTALLNLQNQNQSAVLAILARMNDSEKNLQGALKTINQRQ